MRIIATYDNGVVTFGFSFDGQSYLVRGRRTDGPRILAAVRRYAEAAPDYVQEAVGMAWNNFAFGMMGA